jgi:RNA polymerase sigma factor for flagellar operon FliA
MNTIADTVWQQYRQEPTQEMKKDITLAYVGLVRYVASQYLPQTSGGNVLRSDDIVQFGMIGLLDAIERYDPQRGAKFETYALSRIRGSIQDGLRSVDWVPRSVRQKVKMSDRITQSVENGNLPHLTEGEIAEAFDLSEDSYRELLRATMNSHIPSIVEDADGSIVANAVADEAENPFEQISSTEAREVLIDAIEHLEYRQRLVVCLYYYEGLTFREIAAVLRISETRVFQIHSAVLGDLRTTLAELAQ